MAPNKKNKRNKNKQKAVALPQPSIAPVQHCCYHGSTQGAWNKTGRYYKAMTYYILLCGQANSLEECEANLPEFYKVDDCKQLMLDPEFSRYVFSFCVDKYLSQGLDSCTRFTILVGIVHPLPCRSKLEGRRRRPVRKFEGAQ